MFRFAAPIILIGVAIAGFFVVVKPFYQQVSNLRAEVASYNEALDNSKSLEAERDKLVQKYNSIDPDNLARLEKLLPESVDNIRLILEIEGMASPYGMVLKDVKYDTKQNKATSQQPQGGITPEASGDYGTWNLEFSTAGSYSNFLNFIKDLEKNLRIVDIASIDFSSGESESTGIKGVSPSSSSNNYKYTFKIKTYWLKG